MNQSTDPKENNTKKTGEDRTDEEIKQQQTDPNITELKGFIDSEEALEPKGTDNDSAK